MLLDRMAYTRSQKRIGYNSVRHQSKSSSSLVSFQSKSQQHSNRTTICVKFNLKFLHVNLQHQVKSIFRWKRSRSTPSRFPFHDKIHATYRESLTKERQRKTRDQPWRWQLLLDCLFENTSNDCVRRGRRRFSVVQEVGRLSSKNLRWSLWTCLLAKWAFLLCGEFLNTKSEGDGWEAFWKGSEGGNLELDQRRRRRSIERHEDAKRMGKKVPLEFVTDGNNPTNCICQNYNLIRYQR